MLMLAFFDNKSIFFGKHPLFFLEKIVPLLTAIVQELR